MKFETCENNDDEVKEDDLYKLDKMSLEEKIDTSVRLKAKSKIHMI